MLSIANVASAGHAFGYFARDNYYSREEGTGHSQWFGRGAAELDLRGEVTSADFETLLRGEVAGRELGRIVRDDCGVAQRQHRAGYDLTFSAPKSVSILAEVYSRREARDAHEEAVGKTLAYAERIAAFTRTGHEGDHQASGALVVALFRHDTSRALEPQTHTHAVVINATPGADGRWRSIASEHLYANRALLGAVYNAELAQSLRARGIAVDAPDARGNFEVSGFTRGQLEGFSSRSRDIDAWLREKGHDPARADQALRERAALATRPAKSGIEPVGLVAAWRAQARELGIDPARLGREDARNTGHDIGRDTGRDKGRNGHSPESTAAVAAVRFALDHHTEREVLNTRAEVLRTAAWHATGRASFAQVERAYAGEVEAGRLIEVRGGAAGGRGAARVMVTTARMAGSEQRTMDRLRAGRDVAQPWVAPDAVGARVAAYEAANRLQLTAGQRETVAFVLSTRDRYVGVQGLAGVGKTYALRAVVELAREEGAQVRAMAVSGAAARTLREDTGVGAQTVARFLSQEKRYWNEVERIEAAGGRAPARGRELWLVDESSFAGQLDTARIASLAQRAQARVVFVGDALQLQGVAAGKPFELAQQEAMATVGMHQITRQRDPTLKEVVSLITQEAVDARGALSSAALAHNAAAFDLLEARGRVRELAGEAIVPAIAADYAERAARGAPPLVITGYNADREQINVAIRGELRTRGQLTGEGVAANILDSRDFTAAQRREARFYEPGDVVRFGRDYKVLGVRAGDYASVLAVDRDARTVTLAGPAGTFTWQPHLRNQVEVYREAPRELAVGDRIRFTRSIDAAPAKGQRGGVVTGEEGVVRAIRGQSVRVDVAGTGDRTVTLDVARDRHWDHAYAVTVHAAQGATRDAVIFHIRAGQGGAAKGGADPLHAGAKVFGRRTLYVGATRARDELTVYTDDRAGARRAVMLIQDKSSSLVLARREHDRRTPEPSP